MLCSRATDLCFRLQLYSSLDSQILKREKGTESSDQAPAARPPTPPRHHAQPPLLPSPQKVHFLPWMNSDIPTTLGADISVGLDKCIMAYHGHCIQWSRDHTLNIPLCPTYFPLKPLAPTDLSIVFLSSLFSRLSHCWNSQCGKSPQNAFFHLVTCV